jgi:Tfp pilus assembly major pilin PilA
MQPEPQPPVNNFDEPQPDTPQQGSEPAPTASAATAQTPQIAPPTIQPVAPVQRPTEDPGKLFSILGLVGAFIFLQIPGLILSIIGLKKSKKAGYPATLGIIGICLNVVTMIASIGILAAITLVAYQGVQTRAADMELQGRAETVIKKAEVYSLDADAYPTIEQLRAQDTESQAEQSVIVSTTLKATDQPAGDEIGYLTCTDGTGQITGADVYIYLQSEQRVEYVGSAGICDTVVE